MMRESCSVRCRMDAPAKNSSLLSLSEKVTLSLTRPSPIMNAIARDKVLHHATNRRAGHFRYSYITSARSRKTKKAVSQVQKVRARVGKMLKCTKKPPLPVKEPLPGSRKTDFAALTVLFFTSSHLTGSMPILQRMCYDAQLDWSKGRCRSCSYSSDKLMQ
jgi:hypothetical protein